MPLNSVVCEETLVKNAEGLEISVFGIFNGSLFVSRLTPIVVFLAFQICEI